MSDRRWQAALTAVIVAFAGPGCGFEATRSIPEQIVPGDPAAHAAAKLFEGAPVNPLVLRFEITAEGQADAANVARVLLRSLDLTITSTERPEGDVDCWDFVRSLSVFVESTRSGSALARTLVAQANEPGCVLDLEVAPVPNVNLEPYLEEGLRVVVEATGIPPADNISFDGEYVFRAELL